MPTLAFAPPFTLFKIPIIVRLALSLGLSAFMVSANPDSTTIKLDSEFGLIEIAISELFLGIIMSLALHVLFGAIATAGRVGDIQAGFGLALISDPSLRNRLPLIGTVLSYLAAVIFFSTEGPNDLIGLWDASLQAIPLGSTAFEFNISGFLYYMSAISILALGLAGLLLFALFLVDISIAIMSKTLPQMNVLVLGFQVKTLVVLTVLPIAISTSLALYLRLIRLALDATPAWL
ncbi:flagellar biosynthetic protein FliR [Candidatus Phycosocius spiralis]|uniref:flagellar biosynthetic protein FliR n=1 Tax=Candidatus Phycosocius spiralis TaxID=2815099 RepID=UPI0024E08694|nr:flagellar biosynthetic protein FliR [Candidatus Phycosocius spiralis]